MGQQSARPSAPPTHVFISYARSDHGRVKPIVAALEAHGVSVWWDHALSGGAAFAREIETALRAAEAVIVVWSHASVESDWVRDEASLGRDLGRLVPVRLDDVAAPLGFGQYQMVNLTAWNERSDAPEIAEVLRAVASVGGAATESPDAPSTTPRPAIWRRRSAVLGALAAIPLAAAGVWWLGARPGPAARKIRTGSVAVLPFANLSGDPTQDYFSDGLTEELIAALARLQSLQVVGGISSFRFKGSKEGSAAIGAKLGVAYLLGGAVRREGDRVRVSAQLIDTATGFELWSQTYDRDFKDILATQGGIARTVARELNVTLTDGGSASIGLGSTFDPAAFDAYLQGRRLLRMGGDASSFQQALARFNAALAIDPRFASAEAARASASLILGDQYADGDTHLALYADALAAAKRAVALAPDLADAQAALGDTLATAFLDFPGAKRAYALAMASGQSQPDVLIRFGLFSCDMGGFAVGLAALNRAVLLDPLNPQAFLALGQGQISARRYPDAIAAFRQGLNLGLDQSDFHGGIGQALFLEGRLKAASAEFAQEPTAWLRRTGLAIVDRKMGDSAGATAALRDLATDSNVVSFYQQFQIFAQWGEPDRAFGALDDAIRSKDSGVVALKTDPLADPVRSDPRFTSTMAKLGLSPGIRESSGSSVSPEVVID